MSPESAFIDELRKRYYTAQKSSDLLASPSEFTVLVNEFVEGAARFGNEPLVLDSNKRKECAQFLRFAFHYPEFPSGAVQIGEMPDFIVSTAKSRIGIELREVYVESRIGAARDPHSKATPHQQEHVRDQIVQKAQEIHAARGGIPLRIEVLFQDSTELRKNEVPAYATVLATCVPKRLRERKQPVFLRDCFRNKPWPCWLRNVLAGPRPPFLRSTARWCASHGGCAYPGRDIIQNAIDTKAKKLDQYRVRDCDEYWLLLDSWPRSVVIY
jgi:hypothetical protein